MLRLRREAVSLALVQQNELGKIIVADQVITTIAGYAALECYGLVGMASQKISDGIGQLLGRESLSKGVSVQSQGDRVFIDVYVIVSYGTKISQVAQNAMEKVRYAVEQKTGIKVAEVNVIVQGVRVID
ncbi:MAG: Asp23/Gls24 family envelope stress response protein [Clostridia bacterium]|nr:Asp23/Gls24 family envelope stress response protein [Clostridia bacterium]